jgi:hypothetical protein
LSPLTLRGCLVTLTRCGYRGTNRTSLKIPSMGRERRVGFGKFLLY